MFYILLFQYALDKVISIVGVFFRNFLFTIQKVLRFITARVNYAAIAYGEEITNAIHVESEKRSKPLHLCDPENGGRRFGADHGIFDFIYTDDYEHDHSLDSVQETDPFFRSSNQDGFLGKEFHKDTEIQERDQFYERGKHGFWPYFCRTFFDYFAPKPAHIAAVWRVSRDDYHNSQHFFYRMILSIIRTVSKSSYSDHKLYVRHPNTNYRRIKFRWLFLPKVLLSTFNYNLVASQHYLNQQLVNFGFPSFVDVKKGLFFKNKYIVFYTIFFLTTTLWSFYHFNTVAAIWFVSNLAVVMPIALLWQTFVFFYKTYQISKYTTQNQRFWKRSLTLFWLIEGFLFMIVVFVWFISPDNLKYGINHQEVIFSRFFDTRAFIYTIANVSVVLVTVRTMLFYKVTNNKLIYNILTYVLLSALTLALVTELNQLINLFTNSSTLVQNRTHSHSHIGCTELFKIHSVFRESVVYDQIKFLIIFLKFWHVLFIAVFIVFNVLRGLNTTLSYDAISSIYLNCSYLYFFNLTSIIFFSKTNLYFLLNTPTYHYFITNKLGYSYIILNNMFFITKQLFLNFIS